MSFTFNGITSDSMKVIVERYPARPVPERIVQTVSIPGRNGLLTRTEGFANVRQDYEVYLSAAAAGLPSVAAAMAAWLLAPEGYARLEDSYNPGEFRMGRLVNPEAITNFFNRSGGASCPSIASPRDSSHPARRRPPTRRTRPSRTPRPSLLCHSSR